MIKGCATAAVLLAILFIGVGAASARGPHVFFDVGVPIWWGPWWGPPAPYTYPAPPPVVVQQAPVMQAPTQPPVYWYYCPSSQGYYPYVQHCPSSWLQVVPPAAPPAQPAAPSTPAGP
jgi:hypothetical protein